MNSLVLIILANIALSIANFYVGINPTSKFNLFVSGFCACSAWYLFKIYLNEKD